MCTTQKDMAQKRARKMYLVERSLRCARRNQHLFRFSDPVTSSALKPALADNDGKTSSPLL